MFNGPEYIQSRDEARLSSQFKRIFDLMLDREYRTLREIEDITKDPAASVSAQLRHMRKERFGAHTVNRRARKDASGKSIAGLYEYQLLVSAYTC